ncbi:MAG: hypothetical protein WB471_15455 [Nocardioides sp.]
MAKALMGHLHSYPRDPRVVADNARLRQRVAELESLVVQLSEENDRIVAELLDSAPRQEMQPA